MSEGNSKVVKKKWWLVIPVLLVLLILVWIALGDQIKPLNGDFSTVLQTPTPTEIFCCVDCGWNVGAVTWVDENGDGIRDPEEPPLSDVTIFVEETWGELHSVFSDNTGWYGEAFFGFWLAGCPEVSYQASAEVPDGYQLISSSMLEPFDDYPDEVYGFGFAPLPGTPTLTPRPNTQTCTSYAVMDQGKPLLTDIEAADGTIWVSSWRDGVAQYNSDLDEWIQFTTEDGLISDEVNSITIADNNEIWFATSGGVSIFDGVVWTSYTVEDGLVGMEVLTVTISPSGEAWFGTSEGVSRFNPSSGEWQNFTTEDGLKDNHVELIMIMPDGTVVFSSKNSDISYFNNGHFSNIRPSWMGTEINNLYDYSTSTDGEYWLLAVSNDAYLWNLDFPSGTLVRGENQYSPMAIESDAEGSVWVVSIWYDNLGLHHFIVDEDQVIQEIYAVDLLHDQFISPVYNHELYPVGITIASDGAVWIATELEVARCEFSDQ